MRPAIKNFLYTALGAGVCGMAFAYPTHRTSFAFFGFAMASYCALMTLVNAADKEARRGQAR